jgi:hypothetical protein
MWATMGLCPVLLRRRESHRLCAVPSHPWVQHTEMFHIGTFGFFGKKAHRVKNRDFFDDSQRDKLINAHAISLNMAINPKLSAFWQN